MLLFSSSLRSVPVNRLVNFERLQRFCARTPKYRKRGPQFSSVEIEPKNRIRTADIQQRPQLIPATVNWTQLEQLIGARQYLVTASIDPEKVQFTFSREFTDFLVAWCIAKSADILQNRLDAVEISLCVANILRSMKMTLTEINKKRPPRSWLDELSRLYALGLQKLVKDDRLINDPGMVNRILCYYADACCNFNYDPSAPDVDVWPSWYEVSKRWMEEVDSSTNWKSDSKSESKADEEFNAAYAYLLSIIIDVTLRFKRMADFKMLQSSWETRIAMYLTNLKERNQYILSLRMATLQKQHDDKFTDTIAARLAKEGISRNYNEYQFRKGLGKKPSRIMNEKLNNDSD